MQETSMEEEADERFAVSVPKHKPKSKAELRSRLSDGDPYKLLELDGLRWRASAEDIKRAYRRLALKHHPDKQQTTDDSGDAMFKAITEAFELLYDVKKRREFDSLDEFDDSIPAFDPESDDFIETFAPVFERNSRWSELPHAPLLGDHSSSFDQVAAFYNFWFDFKTWRDFADADEYQPEDASFREERRWMERQNEKLRAKKRKEEKARITRLVQLAYGHDPRVKAHLVAQKEQKTKAKMERAARVQREKEQEAKVESDRLAQEQREKEEAALREKADAAERKKQKEKQQKAVRKARARLRAVCKADSLCEDEPTEMLCNRLSLERLESLCDQLEAARAVHVEDAKRLIAAELEAEAKLEDEEKTKSQADAASAADATKARASVTKPPWTENELGLLTKAANKFPGGVPSRWLKMAEFINHLASPCNSRTEEEVIVKVKSLRAEVALKATHAAGKQDPSPAPSPPAPPAPKKSTSSATTPRVVTPNPGTADEEPKPAMRESSTVAPTGGSPRPAMPASTCSSKNTEAAPTPAAETTASEEWSPQQQRSLEQALAKFPASVGAERWDRIAECVVGKTKAECVIRFQQIVAALKAKRAAAGK